MCRKNPSAGWVDVLEYPFAGIASRAHHRKSRMHWMLGLMVLVARHPDEDSRNPTNLLASVKMYQHTEGGFRHKTCVGRTLDLVRTGEDVSDDGLLYEVYTTSQPMAPMFVRHCFLDFSADVKCSVTAVVHGCICKNPDAPPSDPGIPAWFDVSEEASCSCPARPYSGIRWHEDALVNPSRTTTASSILYLPEDGVAVDKWTTLAVKRGAFGAWDETSGVCQSMITSLSPYGSCMIEFPEVC
jgi:hypothetical protein